ncbi:MAG TPA: hypothetical protein DDW20_02655 [Firmicutes bacterium]|nr:hypothetical protein [Bacillota bacterium]
MTFLTREQAHQAVETACNYILADKFDTQEKLLMFDNYSQAVCFCVVAGLIEPDWLEDLLDYIQVAREAVLKK